MALTLAADWNAGAVFRHGPGGAYVETFTEEIRWLEGWAAGPVDGVLFVADWEAGVIRRHDPDTGEALGPFAGGGGLRAPNRPALVAR